MSDINLLPCPFCDGAPLQCSNTAWHPMYWVLCRVCHASPGTRNGPLEAAAAWNSRKGAWQVSDAGEENKHYTIAIDRRPKEIGGVKVSPGLYRIHWKSGGSSLAAIGMCSNGAWWVAPTNWTAPAVAFRIDEDPEGRCSWASIEALERIDRDYRDAGEDVRALERRALDDLQQAEAEYRLMHDRHGDDSQAAGRAWILMRRAGDNARAVLNGVRT